MSLNRNGFQTRVNRQLPPAVLGDFASMNPRATALAGAGAFRSGNGNTYLSVANLAIVGAFAWGAGQLAGSQKPVGASVGGFVANELQTIIPFPSASDVNYPNAVRLAVETGFDVTLFTHGDFWAIPANPVNGIVSAGDEVYARQYDGALTNDATAFSATGVQTGASSTVTISAVTKGALVPGMVLAGAGVDVGLTVTAQLTGTAGGAGTYTVSTTTGFTSTTVTSAAVDTLFKWQSNTVADASFTGVVAAGTGVLTVSAITGTIDVPANGVDGPYLNGVGVPANTFIVSQLSGSAGVAGTYQLNYIGPAIGSVSMTTSEGKLAKISRTY